MESLGRKVDFRVQNGGTALIVLRSHISLQEEKWATN
jgi:hypothetical protein